MTALDANKGETQATVSAPPPYGDILCAIDGSRASAEAARQAIAIAGTEAKLTFIAVAHRVGAGLVEQAELSEPRAEEALKRAEAAARRAGASAETDLRSGTPPSDVLLDAAASHDLLVVGGHDQSRVGGIMTGSTASQAAHRTDRALLMARRPPSGEEFLDRVLLASDGSPGSWPAARAASHLARAHGSRVEIVYVPDGVHPGLHRELARQVVAIEEETGSEPAVADWPGHVPARILEVADAERSSLIVIGRRGLKGLRALGSVSERVAHRAPCSVLLVPREPAGD